MAGRFSVEAVFKAVDRITTPVSRMQKSVTRFQRRVSRGFDSLNRVIGKFAAGIKKAGVIAAGVFLASSVAMADVANTGAEFEQAIVNVGATSLQTRAQIKPLEKLALELGRTTKFTATQAANAMEIMAKSGFNANEILAGTPGILSAAAASGLEIAEVADVVSNALKGMGMQASQAGEVADVLALASVKTNSTVGSLGEGLRNVSTKAKQLNIPFTDVIASLALMQDAGLDASVSGSALNVMLTKIAAPTAGMQKKMKDLGISFKDSAGDMLSLPKVLAQFNSISGQVKGNMGKVAFFAELVGLRGEKATGILGDLFASGKFTTLSKELKEALGISEKMAKLRMDTFEGSMLLLGSAVDAVKVKIFNLQGGVLKGVVDDLTKWVGKYEDLIAVKVSDFLLKIVANLDKIIKVVKMVVGGILTFIAVITVFKLVGAAVFILSTTFSAFGLVVSILSGGMTAFLFIMSSVPKVLAFARMAMLALSLAFAVNPIGLLIIAITALIAIAGLIFLAWDPISKFFSNIFDKIKKVVDIAAKGIGALGDFFGYGDNKTDVGNFTKLISNSGIGDFFGFGESKPNIVSPQDRIAKSIEENRSTEINELTIKDETGRAEITKGNSNNRLMLEPSGGF